MKAKDLIFLAILAAVGAIAYVIFGKKSTVAAPTTATTGTAGIGSLLFGQPATGATSASPNYAGLLTSGTTAVKGIVDLFQNNASQTSLNSITNAAPASYPTGSSSPGDVGTINLAGPDLSGLGGFDETSDFA